MEPGSLLEELSFANAKLAKEYKERAESCGHAGNEELEKLSANPKTAWDISKQRRCRRRLEDTVEALGKRFIERKAESDANPNSFVSGMSSIFESC